MKKGRNGRERKGGEDGAGEKRKWKSWKVREGKGRERELPYLVESAACGNAGTAVDVCTRIYM